MLPFFPLLVLSQKRAKASLPMAEELKEPLFVQALGWHVRAMCPQLFTDPYVPWFLGFLFYEWG